TLYRHFPNKQALLIAMVRERFQGMADLARAAERISDPREAFEAILRTYLEAADGDAAFQLALMGSEDLKWDGVQREKAEFAEIVGRIIDRAVTGGRVRADFTVSDFRVVAGGVMSTMYFRSGGDVDWRRHLTLVLDGIRVENGVSDG
ncbi:MAG: TetR/AcrR family transcriptional regulator, partial [Stackebrandtia sp.]